jgi:UDPglucose--hexose-1-phosphate uridylyltransferase
VNELRQDPTTGNWVIVAPERGVRPHVPAIHDEAHPSGPCPFCPGNESRTPPELWRLAGADGGWHIRVVPNKFAALTPHTARSKSNADGFASMAARGHHEVIIESPRHDADLATATLSQVRAVLTAYRLRYRALSSAKGIALIVIFRNHGSASGTSLDHPHSQILATPILPPQVRQRLDLARRHFDSARACLYTDVLERELRDGRRIVSADQDVVAFQPYASVAPFETWIMPRRPRASFGHVSDPLLDQLAGMTGAVLGGLREALDDPPYNMVIHTAPIGDEDSGYFSWHMQIVPRLGIAAGFELGTGIAINTSLPEHTAAALRTAVARQRAVTAG